MNPQELQTWLKTTVKEIRELIELESDNSNPVELLEKLNQLASMTATAAMAQATAKKLLLMKQKDLVSKLPEMSASLQVKWLQGELFEEESMVTYCDRLAAGVSNSIEAIRSILSYAKEEMNAAKNQQG